ncbi:rhomboid-domain-containing protein, partial [Microstroma glucosiphilum]
HSTVTRLRGAAPQRPTDSPSVYTDPYEWQSHAGFNTNATNTPNPNLSVVGYDYAQDGQDGRGFLGSDPYASRGQTPKVGANLNRADTLLPGDSISAYKVPAPHPRSSLMMSAIPSQESGAAASYRDSISQRGSYSQQGVGYALPSQQAHGDDTLHSRYDSTASGFDNQSPTKSTTALAHPPYPMAYADDEYDQNRQLTNEPDYYNAEEANTKKGLLGFKQDSLQSQIDKRRRGIGRQRWPIFTWVLSLALVGVFVAELIKANALTGQAIQTHPSINPMIGPSSQFLIYFGARFVPCMRDIPAVPTSTELACLNASTLSTITTSQECPIWEICGLDSATSYGQLWRFVTPIFLHAGIVHILFNMVVLLTLCAQIEKLIGTPFYLLLFIAGGIGGNLLGANFGMAATPSVGASGSIYTCIAIELIDLVYNWSHEAKPKTRLCVSIIFTLVGLALGLLPGLDNFAHIGGMAVGLLGGLLVCPSIHTTKRHRVLTWVFRLIGLALLVAYFVALALNFMNAEDPATACTWCRYLSCLPTFSQCKNNGLTTTTTTSSSS